MRIPRASALTSALAAVLLAACSGGSGAAADHRLADARARWAAAGIRDYRLDLRWFCFCAHRTSVQITVRGGRPAGVTPAPSPVPSTGPFGSTPGNPSGSPSATGAVPAGTPTSVEALFDVVAAARARADRVEVTYDVGTGVPLQTSVDEHENVTDDEESLTVTLTRLPPAGTPVTSLPTSGTPPVSTFQGTGTSQGSLPPLS